jgi:pre-mRNA-processing factor 6
MKSAIFERQQGQTNQALKTLDTALSKYPTFAKLYMIKGQILTDLNDISCARAAFAAGMKAAPKSVPLWILASQLEEKDGRAIKSRALLEKARLVNPKDEYLWAEAVGVEERSSGVAQAKPVLSRGKGICSRVFLTI